MGKKRNVLIPLEEDKNLKHSRISTFDIETINWTEPYALAYYNGKTLRHFKGRQCLKDFIDYFLSYSHRGEFCYAHNGGKFDFSFVLQELLKSEYKNLYQITPLRVGSRIIQIKISRKDSDGHIKDSWTLRDSMAMFAFSLRKLTNNFQVEALKGDFEHEKINWRNWKTLEPEWKPYLENDVKGLYQVIYKFEDYLIKEFRVNLKRAVTIAQLAMIIFRTHFMKLNLPQYEKFEDDIRKSYFGGRTEIFKMYGKNLHYFDINSLYPSVMVSKVYPVGLPIETNNFSEEDFGICLVEIETPKYMKYPLLPKKTKDGKLIFPLGKWVGWYCSPEIDKAKELGYKIKYLKGYKFEKAHIFDDYIAKLYEIKKTSKDKPVDYMTSKLLMNSLYGKFGQRREQKEVIMYPKSIEGLEPLDIFDETPFFTKDKTSTASHILPAIASFVTSYARLSIYEKLEEVILRGGHVYYMDTDSLMCDVMIETSNELGDMSDELGGAKIKEGIFLLPKMYAFKIDDSDDAGKSFIEAHGSDFIKCKGFPKGLFKFESYEKALKNEDYSDFKMKKSRIATPFESLRRNKRFVSMIEFQRSVINRYDKRKVGADYDTEPQIIDPNVPEPVKKKKHSDEKFEFDEIKLVPEINEKLGNLGLSSL